MLELTYMYRWVLQLLIITIPAWSFATTTISGVSGASNYKNVNNAITIYGGIAGPSCTGDGVNTCNNCLLQPNFTGPCNEHSIYTTQNLTITFTSGTAGYPTIGDNVSGAALFYSATQVPANTATSVPGITWSQICQQMTVTNTGNKGPATCNFNGSGTFRVGNATAPNSTLGSDYVTVTIYMANQVGTTPTFNVPANPSAACTTAPGDGICNFQMMPGDQKAVLIVATPTGGFPTGTPVNYDHIRIYYKDGPNPATAAGFTAMTPNNSGAADITFHQDANNNVIVDNDTITGLVNGTRYYFIIGSVDLAQNIGFFSLPTSFTTQPTVGFDYWSAIPQPVYGLLDKNFDCFVATATYGSRQANEVKTLRDFRDYLLKYHRAMNLPWIRMYYKHGPKLAAFIRDNEFLKAVSRAMLWYPIKFAKMTLAHGLAFASLVTLLPLILLGLIIQGWLGLVKKAART